MFIIKQTKSSKIDFRFMYTNSRNSGVSSTTTLILQPPRNLPTNIDRILQEESRALRIENRAHRIPIDNSEYVRHSGAIPTFVVITDSTHYVEIAYNPSTNSGTLNLTYEPNPVEDALPLGDIEDIMGANFDASRLSDRDRVLRELEERHLFLIEQREFLEGVSRALRGEQPLSEVVPRTNLVPVSEIVATNVFPTVSTSAFSDRIRAILAAGGLTQILQNRFGTVVNDNGSEHSLNSSEHSPTVSETTYTQNSQGGWELAAPLLERPPIEQEEVYILGQNPQGLEHLLFRTPIDAGRQIMNLPGYDRYGNSGYFRQNPIVVALEEELLRQRPNSNINNYLQHISHFAIDPTIQQVRELITILFRGAFTSDAIRAFLATICFSDLGFSVFMASFYRLLTLPMTSSLSQTTFRNLRAIFVEALSETYPIFSLVQNTLLSTSLGRIIVNRATIAISNVTLQYSAVSQRVNLHIATNPHSYRILSNYIAPFVISYLARDRIRSLLIGPYNTITAGIYDLILRPIGRFVTNLNPETIQQIIELINRLLGY